MENKVKVSSIITKDLSRNDIISICKIKKEQYKFSLNDQIKWFNKNIKKNYIHNLVCKDNKIIGYNCLRLNRSSKSNKLILFDTIILKKRFRGNGYSKLILLKSNDIIFKRKAIGILFCKFKMIKFYKKFNWKIFKLPENLGIRNNLICMVFTKLDKKKLNLKSIKRFMCNK